MTYIQTGRKLAGRPRVSSESGPRYCPDCDARMVWGEPNPNYPWDRLRFTDDQMDLLLLAASEFDKISEDNGDESWAVSFVDWIRPDVLGLKGPVPSFDGSPPRYASGVVVSNRAATEGSIHRHPDPIPLASDGVRHSRSRRAS